MEQKRTLWVELNVRGCRRNNGTIVEGTIRGKSVVDDLVQINGLTPKLRRGRWLKVVVIKELIGTIKVSPADFMAEEHLTKRKITEPVSVGPAQSFNASTLQRAKDLFEQEETRLRAKAKVKVTEIASEPPKQAVRTSSRCFREGRGVPKKRPAEFKVLVTC